MTAPIHVVVAGAGIGGLTAALSLARAGCRVTLLERADVLQETGAGLQLSPNASGILAGFGIAERLVGQALAPERLRIRSARSGADIVRMPLGPVAEMRWGAPTLVVHRGDLQRALLDAVSGAAGIDLRLGVEVAGFVMTRTGVTVATRSATDGNRAIEADLLVGADGAHSVIRQRLALQEDDRPVYSGRTAWRALVPGDAAPDFALRLETSLWLGSRAHLVHYPLRQGALVNVVAITEDHWRGAADGDVWSQPGDAAQLRRRFSGWASDARQLISQAPEWRRWPLFDRNPLSRWCVERVALLGDAAHPMLPFFAQGAAQAIEDADVLGRALGSHESSVRPDIAAALRTYQQQRIERATRVQRASRRQASIYHLPGPAALARDIGMRALGQERLMSRFDWLYSFRN